MNIFKGSGLAVTKTNLTWVIPLAGLVAMVDLSIDLVDPGLVIMEMIYIGIITIITKITMVLVIVIEIVLEDKNVVEIITDLVLVDILTIMDDNKYIYFRIVNFFHRDCVN